MRHIQAGCYLGEKRKAFISLFFWISCLIQISFNNCLPFPKTQCTAYGRNSSCLGLLYWPKYSERTNSECGKKRYPKYNQHHPDFANHPLYLLLAFCPTDNDTHNHVVSLSMKSQKYISGIKEVPKEERIIVDPDFSKLSDNLS